MVFPLNPMIFQRVGFWDQPSTSPSWRQPGGRQSRSQMHVPAARVHALARAYSYGHVEPWGARFWRWFLSGFNGKTIGKWWFNGV
jgi:hypothetical protein